MDNKLLSIPGILKNFAQRMHVVMQDNRLDIPARYGTGYCAGYVFNPHIRMLISNYELNRNIDIENPDVDPGKRVIFFKFQNIFPDAKKLPGEKTATTQPSVLIATSHINTQDVIAIHSNTATINIEVDAAYLYGVFQTVTPSPLLQGLLQNTQPLFFEQLLIPALQHVVNEILTSPTDRSFRLYFLRIKAEELICRLLMELEKRDEKQLYPLNNRDVSVIYKIKEQLLAHLDKPPLINELATYAGMSSTKLKRLFRQIFGDSIFSYYQHFRMVEAARLLRAEKLSVSDVGYRLGFTNLSHFARVFNDHWGMKPKRYSRA